MNKQARGLLKENNELSKRLDPNYDKVLTDIVVYIRGTNISDYQQELIRQDITHMMLEGAHRGDPVESVVGQDYKAFCDNVLAEVPPMKTKYKVVSVIAIICSCLSVLLAIWFISELIDLVIGKTSWPYFSMTVGNLISTVLTVCFSMAFFLIITKNSFSETLINIKTFLILTTILSLLMLINIFLKEVLFSIHVVVAIFVVLALFVASKLLDLIEEPTEKPAEEQQKNINK